MQHLGKESPVSVLSNGGKAVLDVSEDQKFTLLFVYHCVSLNLIFG